MERKYKIIAVDFDGTLCEDKFPEIGKATVPMIEFIKLAKQKGVKVILWTCRAGEKLDEAVEWCRNQGLEFDAINENLPEVQQEWKMDTRKVYCDVYIDDKNVLASRVVEKMCKYLLLKSITKSLEEVFGEDGDNDEGNTTVSEDRRTSDEDFSEQQDN